MTYAARMVVQMLCLFSYLWASSCVANVLQMHQASLEQHTQIIVDNERHALIVHHQGHRDLHEPEANGTQSTDGDHIIKLACIHPDLSLLAAKVAFDHAVADAVLLGYLPPPVFSYPAAAKTLLLAQQPPPAVAPPPISRNSSIAIVQLTNLRI